MHIRSEPRTLSLAEGYRDFGLETWVNGDYSNLWRPTRYIQYPVSAERFRESETAIEGPDRIVIDNITGLMWQQLFSDTKLAYETAGEYIHELNQHSFAGHKDWRLPTIPELISLLQPDFYVSSGGHFMDSVFEKARRPGHSFWSADRCGTDKVWCVNFAILDVSVDDVSYKLFVRVVRSHGISKHLVDHACRECKGKGRLIEIHHSLHCLSGFPAGDVWSGLSMSGKCSCDAKQMEKKCWQCGGTGMFSN